MGTLGEILLDHANVPSLLKLSPANFQLHWCVLPAIMNSVVFSWVLLFSSFLLDFQLVSY